MDGGQDNKQHTTETVVRPDTPGPGSRQTDELQRKRRSALPHMSDHEVARSPRDHYQIGICDTNSKGQNLLFLFQNTFTSYLDASSVGEMFPVTAKPVFRSQLT